MDEKEQALLKAFAKPVQSPKELRDWVLTFLDIDLPVGHVDEDSTSSPGEAIYDAYACYRDDKCLQEVGYIWLSARDCYKTLGGSILNIMLMIHFKAQISHMAAIRKQAEKSIQYCNTFIRKLKPYIEASGGQIVTESKSKIQILNPDESVSYIDILVANLAGGNSEHVPVASFDELECLSPQGLVGYKEAKLVPTRYKNRGPITIKYSTRKFAFGIFAQEIEEIQKTGEQLRKWNILDVTEKCPSSRHRPDLPKIDMYISKELPMFNLSVKQYLDLGEKEKEKYRKINAYAGCEKCPLLPVCKTNLAHRDESNTGGLYKSIDFTVRQFKVTTDIDIAVSQLLCLRPSRVGLVYPRFEDEGNVISIKEAYERYMGVALNNKDFGLPELVSLLKQKGVKFYVGGDWGTVANQAFVVSAMIPGGEWWILDSYSIPGLEFDEVLELAKKIRDEYRPVFWAMDTARPEFIKTFRRNGMSCKNFKKDVWAGIEMVRGQIVNAFGVRKLKVVKHPRNDLMIGGIKKHFFILDSAGLPTEEPDNGEAWSDLCDSLRYLAQNLFGKTGKISVAPNELPPANIPQMENARSYESWVTMKARALASEDTSNRKIRSSSGTFFADFGGNDDTDT